VSGGALQSLNVDDQSHRTPLIRWNVDDQKSFQHGELPVQFGVFLKRIAEFDAAIFGISSTEAALMDPQQRLILESVAELMNKIPVKEGVDRLLSQWGVFVVSRLNLHLDLSQALEQKNMNDCAKSCFLCREFL